MLHSINKKESDFHLTPSLSLSGKRGSNPRPSAWEADALPLSYSRFSDANIVLFFKFYLIPKPIILFFYQPNKYANINGATIVASDSMINLGVVASSFPQVIFSLGTAPEYEP